MSHTLIDHTLTDYTLIDYIWIGGNYELRSKVRVIYEKILPTDLEKIPTWNYDGSSTSQADGSTSEVFIRPRRVFRCPFRRPHSLIVMCDTYTPEGEPVGTNHRHLAQKIFEKYSDQKPWYGIEQEYFIADCQTNQPCGFDPSKKQGQFYCSVGAQNAFGRDMVEEHLEACLYAGIKISGINAEVAPGQWEFQVGPVEGIDASDQLWVARYILEKIGEKYQKYIIYHPKPLEGDWNGSGCHTNFSTDAMRKDGGLDIILGSMDKLASKHMSHMEIYGKDNHLRMSGLHETSKFDEFTFGIGSRKCSLRIPNETVQNKKGYFEDRRPASNMDPYRVTAGILETLVQ